MCVIILKKPTVVIPFEKIESACDVNADGFGVSVLNDDKTLTTYHSFNPKGNDPKELQEVIEKHNDQQMYIHLRYSTKGEKNKENCHPFTLVSDEEKNFELQLMHNGTLSYHGLTIPTGSSDTRAFVESDGQRFSKIFYNQFGTDLLKSDDYQRFLELMLEDKWYFLTYDNLGNYLIQGKDKGHWHDNDSWWSSNTYSFTRNYRTSNYSNSSYSDGYWEKGVYRPYPKKTQGDNSSVPFLPAPKTNTTGSNTTSSGTTDTASKGTQATTTSSTNPNMGKESECRVIGYALSQARQLNLKWLDHTPPKERATFCDMASLHNLEETFVMSEEEIYDLCIELPEAATALIMDLMDELYALKKSEKKVAA